MILYNTITDAEPEPRPLARGLTGKKRVKEFIQNSLGYSGPMVSDNKAAILSAIDFNRPGRKMYLFIG
jgi:hypothetical protein